MRPKFKRIDSNNTSVRELTEKFNALVDELERVLCRIGEDNLDVNLRNKIKGGDKND